MSAIRELPRRRRTCPRRRKQSPLQLGIIDLVRERPAETISQGLQFRLNGGMRNIDACLYVRPTQMKRRGVTLALLWQEYRGEHAQGYAYSWFCERYSDWRKRITPTMRQTHVAGEKRDRGTPRGATHRVTGGGRPPPVPTERSVRISRTTLFGRCFTALQEPATPHMGGAALVSVTASLL